MICWVSLNASGTLRVIALFSSIEFNRHTSLFVHSIFHCGFHFLRWNVVKCSQFVFGKEIQTQKVENHFLQYYIRGFVETHFFLENVSSHLVLVTETIETIDFSSNFLQKKHNYCGSKILWNTLHTSMH